VANSVENEAYGHAEDQTDNRTPKTPAQFFEMVAERHARFGKDVVFVGSVSGEHGGLLLQGDGARGAGGPPNMGEIVILVRLQGSHKRWRNDQPSRKWFTDLTNAQTLPIVLVVTARQAPL